MTSSDKQATVYERQLDLALASIHACATRHSTTSSSVEAEARPADAVKSQVRGAQHEDHRRRI